MKLEFIWYNARPHPGPLDCEPPLNFPDLAAVQTWTDANAVEAVADRIQRGLYVQMNPFEVAMAKRKLPAAGA